MSALEPSRAASANDVAELAARIYGTEIGPMRGVLHVAAVTDEGGAHRVIRIGPHAPKSATDSFVLELARARVDAIVVTGAVLREEPDLRYELDRTSESGRGLHAFRQEIAASSDPPWLLVLTRGEVPLAHPALHGWARPILFTSEDAAERLRREAGVPEIVAAPDPSLRGAIDHLGRERGCRSVSVEAGPSTSAALYDDPLAVDELWLSVFEGRLDPRARGGLLPSSDALASAGMERRALSLRVEEPSGAWRFERWVRSAPEGSLSGARRGTAAGSRSPARGSA